MKFNFKSKTGFTLIELLVVIGILAVLAAIAIPSVAGLIDRANISADNTNATEMTNAVERFTSEYELYKQDLSSGTLDTANLDASNSRVFNVTGITTRADIEKFESDEGINGKGVNIDTKYPFNELTIKAVVKNYMKTTSSTFSPKQSDMAFYYSPTAGKVVVAKEGSTYIKLDAIAKTDDIMNNTTQLSTGNVGETLWLNMTLNENSDKLITSIYATDVEKIYAPAPVTLKTDLDPALSEDYDGEAPEDNEIYETDDYKYRFHSVGKYWGVIAKDNTKSSYEPILSMIKGVKVTSMSNTFYKCENLVTSPEIPSTITNMLQTFYECRALTEAPKIPNGVTNMYSTFYCCTKLKEMPELPNTVTNISHAFHGCNFKTATTIPASVTDMGGTFMYCEYLKTAPIMLSGVTNIGNAFYCCKALETVPTIPDTVIYMGEAFYACSSLKSVPALPESVMYMSGAFRSCSSLETAPAIPSKVTNLTYTFERCSSLKTAPAIPNSVTIMDSTFNGCASLEAAPVIPSSVTSMKGTFSTCISLQTAPEIPANVTDMRETFQNCPSLKGDIIINANPTKYVNCFYKCAQNSDYKIIIKGDATIATKTAIKETAYNGGTNVTIG